MVKCNHECFTETASSPVRRRQMDWSPTDDPRLDQIVRVALDDPRDAAMHLAHWIDCRTTHHEGSDAARLLDNWAWDPCRDPWPRSLAMSDGLGMRCPFAWR